MVHVRTIEDADAHVASLWTNYQLLAHRVRTLEKMMDTRATPLWRRVVFRLDGWPTWAIVADKPSWRPWHRWWVS